MKPRVCSRPSSESIRRRCRRTQEDIGTSAAVAGPIDQRASADGRAKRQRRRIPAGVRHRDGSA